MIVTMILILVTTIPAMLINKFNISFVPFVVFSNMYHPLTIHTSGKFSKCTHSGERRTADRFGSTHIIIAQLYSLFNNYFIVYLIDCHNQKTPYTSSVSGVHCYFYGSILLYYHGGHIWSKGLFPFCKETLCFSRLSIPYTVVTNPLEASSISSSV